MAYKSKIMKALDFLNLLDYHKKLSITNVAVIIMVVKLAFIPTFNLTEVAAFFIAMLNYGHKRIQNNQIETTEKKSTESIIAEIDEIKSKVSAIDLKTGLKR